MGILPIEANRSQKGAIEGNTSRSQKPTKAGKHLKTPGPLLLKLASHVDLSPNLSTSFPSIQVKHQPCTTMRGLHLAGPFFRLL